MLTAVKELTYGGIDQVGRIDQAGVMEWKKFIEHLQSVFEDKYWFEDGLYEESVDEFIIGAGGSDVESSSESDISNYTEHGGLDSFLTLDVHARSEG